MTRRNVAQDRIVQFEQGQPGQTAGAALYWVRVNPTQPGSNEYEPVLDGTGQGAFFTDVDEAWAAAKTYRQRDGWHITVQGVCLAD